MNTILVLTALELERQAVLNHLEDIQQELHPTTRTDYRVGYFVSSTGKLRVIVGKTDQTNPNAGIETERALSLYNPSHAFFVGVAGGLKDVNVGDIVIGKTVVGYERGKEDDKRGFLPRPQFGMSSYNLERSADSYGNSDEWKEKSKQLLDTNFSAEIKVFSGTIAAGEKVVSNVNSATYQYIKQNISNALALEMEGYGFLEACRHYFQLQSLLLRGISDLIKGKENSDESGSQVYASQNVAAFLFGLIDKIPFQNDVLHDTNDDILELLYKLYPHGVEDTHLWERAGGVLYRIRLNTSGGEQWYEAIKLIEKGIGGVTMLSIIAEMKKDYPENKLLQSYAL
jgi:nucleoside phosphorylase